MRELKVIAATANVDEFKNKLKAIFKILATHHITIKEVNIASNKIIIYFYSPNLLLTMWGTIGNELEKLHASAALNTSHNYLDIASDNSAYDREALNTDIQRNMKSYLK
jgi:hypothetical protein